MLVGLDLIKRQCRVDFDDDDKLLEAIGEAAEAEVIRITERTLDELLEMGDGRLPVQLRQAVLVRAAQLYANPEGTDKPNALFESLVRPFQKL